ncbi:33 kDa chaperonin [Collibacillus ludicampi]|uniref:33 kDa chaperonin n=1 Tax=Collibacillus ludicampi TaxID=2771369 RepID=A0AAV4LE24_9BACL|nr:Hsp33 family molecular chaperone HslO [Collibacillus ludicampi]GIM46075.1 33 kDa chaperonin [Collibacillus ludicampi]
MSDYAVRATASDGNLRAFAVLTTELVEEMRKRHDTFPVATAALGRTASVGAIMGLMLKGEDRLTIQIKGGGPIGQIVVDANAKGEVRGFVTNPHVDLPLNERGKLDVRGAVGTNGFLYVIKDLGLKEPYRGSVPLISGELGEDFAYYFTQSEQTPSAVGVGVLVNPDYSVKVAGGFLIQVLPGVSEEEINTLETEIAKVTNLTEWLSQGVTPEELLNRLLPGEVKIHEKIPLSFACTCNRERLKEVILSLGVEEIRSMLEEDKQAEIVCSFCVEKYVFTETELEQLLRTIEEAPSRKEHSE